MSKVLQQINRDKMTRLNSVLDLISQIEQLMKQHSTQQVVIDKLHELQALVHYDLHLTIQTYEIFRDGE